MPFQIAASLAIGLLQLLAYFRAERFWRLGVLIEQHRFAVRNEARRAAGAEWLEVRVEGSPQALGSSVETPSELSARPALQTDQSMLRDARGRRLRIPAGKKMRVLSLPGARRHLIEGVTTASGVEQRYSFELDPATAFRLLAIVPKQGRGPFREGEAVEVAPFDDVYLIGDDTDEAQPQPRDEPGCGGRRVALGGLALNLAGAVLVLVPYLGLALWAIALLLGSGLLFGHLVDALDPPKLADEDPLVRARVAADLARLPPG